jgi:hypothetical protein
MTRPTKEKDPIFHNKIHTKALFGSWILEGKKRAGKR